MAGDHEDSGTCDISISSNCSRCARVHDGRNAKAWLEVTEAEQELRGLLVSRSFDGLLLCYASTPLSYRGSVGSFPV